MLENVLDTYKRRFAKLHRDSARSRWPAITLHSAPHKPVLLLSVLDLFAQGSIQTNLIEPTLELGEIFTLYWSCVMPPDQRGNLALPFFHLKSDGFWHLVPIKGNEDYVFRVQQIRSITHLRECVIGAQLDEELFGLLQNKKTRDTLRVGLIETYFAPELRDILVQRGAINIQAFDYSQMLLGTARSTDLKIIADEENFQQQTRDQGFRRAIVIAYQHQCSFCELRILTADGHTVVDAAHIIPWSVSHNDSPRNGIALCQLCHWAFDEGLMSVSSKYSILTSSQLSFNRNSPGSLPSLQEKTINCPDEKELWPDLEAFEWHRKEVYRKR